VDARLKLFLVACCFPVSAAAFDHAHVAWSALLRRHVVLVEGGKASQVRYAGMARERRLLKAYLEGLSAVPEGDFQRWAREEQMSFLINAYNAFTVEKILTRYPDVGSIWDFGRIFGHPFKDRFFTLLGSRRSLDYIEHEILRKRYAEPRIHYAINCAAVSCPMLREEAYVPARLESQLEEQARRFLSDRSRNRLREGRLEVSKIFDWFKQDFGVREAYFARFAALLSDRPDEQELIANGKAPVIFLDYDWSLNDFVSSSRR
jgi:hypothetical protein